MIKHEYAIGIANLAIPILYIENRNSISLLKSSMVDIEASILSEISSHNNSISRIIEFNKKIINVEYIEYLEKIIKEMIDVTISDNSAKKISNTVYQMRNNSKVISNEELSERFKLVEGRLGNLLRHDIKKSSDLDPILKSKTLDVVKSLNITFENLESEFLSLSKKLIECENFIEACSFCEYIYKTKVESHSDFLSILEDDYEIIFKNILNIYYEFKGGGTCPYL